MANRSSQYQAVGKAYKNLGQSWASFMQKRTQIGSLAPQIAEVRKSIEQETQRQQERMQLLGAVMQFGAGIEENVTRQKLMERGATEMGIDLPRQSLFDKFRTAVSGPRTGGTYGEQGISGGALIGLGQTTQEFPWALPRMKEMISTYLGR